MESKALALGKQVKAEALNSNGHTHWWSRWKLCLNILLNLHYLQIVWFLITGAGDGIGRAAAKSFAAHGATVILLGRTISKLVQESRSIQTIEKSDFFKKSDFLDFWVVWKLPLSCTRSSVWWNWTGWTPSTRHLSNESWSHVGWATYFGCPPVWIRINRI